MNIKKYLPLNITVRPRLRVHKTKILNLCWGFFYGQSLSMTKAIVKTLA
jgi:hypothetical protein